MPSVIRRMELKVKPNVMIRLRGERMVLSCYPVPSPADREFLVLSPGGSSPRLRNGGCCGLLDFVMRSFDWILLVCCVLCCGCKEPVRTYRIAADPEAPAVSAQIPDEKQEKAAVTWQAMPGWTQESAGQFLTAAYTINGLGRLTVSKLAGDGGGLAANVNRWRGQVQLEPLPEDQVQGQAMPVTGSTHEFLLFNLTKKSPATDEEGIFAAVLPLERETWYFKLTGNAVTLQEKGAEAFTSFLSTVRVGGDAAPVAPEPPQPAKPKIHVTSPEGWIAAEPGTMRVASYTVKGAAGETADVSVIPLPGNSGSILENVNRWRGQVQLPPLSTADDPALGSEMEGEAGRWFVTHMVSNEAILDGKKVAISAAILKAGGMTWFFKMTGDAVVVGEHRAAFLEFVRSATLP